MINYQLKDLEALKLDYRDAKLKTDKIKTQIRDLQQELIQENENIQAINEEIAIKSQIKLL